MKIIDIIITIEVPDEESNESLAKITSDLENLTASKGYDIYETDWIEQ